MSQNIISKIVDHVNKNGSQSCRKLAELFKQSKSSIHRTQQKVNARSGISGANFFETEEGQHWLLRLVVAVIFIFGITAGIGSERIALFFSLINMNEFIGLSGSSITKIENMIDDLIIKFKDKMDNKVKNKAPELDVTVGVDETFFDNLMLLVGMDLTSGFIFIETPTEKRDHETWQTHTSSWLSQFKFIRCFVSDKAKALLKLSQTFEADRMPDLFHMMHDISIVMRYPFHRMKTSTEKKIKSVKKAIDKGVNEVNNRIKLIELKERIRLIVASNIKYNRNLRKLSIDLHPFSILSSSKQSGKSSEEKMLSSLSDIKQTRDKFEVSDAKNRLERVEKQIPDAAKQIDLWWGWVETSLETIDMTPEFKNWLLYYLLPLIYWSRQIKKTTSKKIRRYYLLSKKYAERNFKTHPLSASIRIDSSDSEWVVWAQKMVELFLRTTSAVEGRNGWLSQIHFNGRGLSEKRLNSQTAIHNYFLKRSDSTTACERLSGIKPDDLFQYLIANIGVLPQPRRTKGKDSMKPPNSLAVPA